MEEKGRKSGGCQTVCEDSYGTFPQRLSDFQPRDGRKNCSQAQRVCVNRAESSRTVNPSLEKGDRIVVLARGEGSAKSCVSVGQVLGKMTELVRLSPSVSGHKKTPSQPKLKRVR